MTGEKAYQALIPKHRAVIDLCGPDVTPAKAYQKVYGVKWPSAKQAASRLSTAVNFRDALAWKLAGVAAAATEKTVLSLALVLSRVAEVVSAPFGAKTVVADGKLTAITPGVMRPYVETACKVFQLTGELGGQLDPSADITRGRMLPESLSREDADELLERAKKAGKLPGLAKGGPDVVVVEKEEPGEAARLPAVADLLRRA